MAILRDIKTGERFNIRLCKFCTDYKGSPKPIMPDDFLARKEKDGSYKCGVCVQEDIDSAIIKANPNSEKARNILASLNNNRTVLIYIFRSSFGKKRLLVAIMDGSIFLGSR